VTSSTGFGVGNLVLIHQSQGTGAGVWETATVAFVASATSLATSSPLVHTYTNPGAQVVLVPEYFNLSVGATATLTAPAWNGTTGGIFVVHSTGTATVAGTITMSGRGFRGSNHSLACGSHCFKGNSGESSLGAGPRGDPNNGAGGGGGAQGQDCGMGAGGGYGAAGGTGADNTAGTCSSGTTAAGGTATGAADLTQSIFFGGAGGEGGYDEDGGWPGGGGNGGGIVIVLANALSVTGSVTSQGFVGGNGVNSCGGGCGMGGGGGGAGGGIRIVASTATLGANLMSATGAIGGTCTCGPEGASGSGSVGRVAIKAGTVTGATSPAYSAL
jgi:hypothetical protein